MQRFMVCWWLSLEVWCYSMLVSETYPAPHRYNFMCAWCGRAAAATDAVAHQLVVYRHGRPTMMAFSMVHCSGLLSTLQQVRVELQHTSKIVLLDPCPLIASPAMGCWGAVLLCEGIGQIVSWPVWARHLGPRHWENMPTTLGTGCLSGDQNDHIHRCNTQAGQHLQAQTC